MCLFFSRGKGYAFFPHPLPLPFQTKTTRAAVSPGRCSGEFVLSASRGNHTPEPAHRLISHHKTPGIGQTCSSQASQCKHRSRGWVSFLGLLALLVLSRGVTAHRTRPVPLALPFPAPPFLPSQAVSAPATPGAGSGGHGLDIAFPGSLRYSESTARGWALGLGHSWGQGVAEGRAQWHTGHRNLAAGRAVGEGRGVTRSRRSLVQRKSVLRKRIYWWKVSGQKFCRPLLPASELGISEEQLV